MSSPWWYETTASGEPNVSSTVTAPDTGNMYGPAVSAGWVPGGGRRTTVGVWAAGGSGGLGAGGGGCGATRLGVGGGVRMPTELVVSGKTGCTTRAASAWTWPTTISLPAGRPP